MGKFDIILWDVDQTLLDFKKSESYAIRFCFRKFGKEASDETVSAYSSINESFWKQIEKGQINKKEALVERFRTLFRQIGEEDIEAEAFQKEYVDALGSVYYFQDDSYNLLNQLKGKYRQYLVTNGVTYTQMKKLRLSGLDKLVDGIFVSEQLGVPKPHKEFFEQCFCAIPGFQREKALIVGDSLSSDMQGGNNAQISTCWYNPAGLENPFNIRIDYQIKDLNEIWNVLEDMAD